MAAETLQALQIAAITLACVSGLFGVYVVLVVLAIWATYRHVTVSSKRLRWVTIALFLDLLAHFITRSLQFARARLMSDTNEELLRWSIPLTVVGNFTTTVAAFLSDGTLAWRFYVVFNKEKWALYLPAASVILNALLCWSADGQHLAIYSNEEFYEKTLLPVTLDITVAWGWSMFFANSLMTGGIIYKIAWANRTVQSLRESGGKKSRKYVTALRAVIESALVTWFGILLFEIGSLAPSGHVTTNKNVGLVVLEILPIFFGISQCLITAHLGILRETRDMVTIDYYSWQSDGQQPSTTPAFKVFTNVTTITDSQDFQVEMEESKSMAMT
ncbi:hypothetical protein DFH94DRAFT_410415 [Russula ochroleuca]|uniref:Uncharacterized protein n=1 Tax=Russula ochroleuca TaxID=152965 RepID=A0A9P5MYN3_9AGAM|nr:hypothetical protein DFH94DRAFT_410415 [Russula ochroleuca]